MKHLFPHSNQCVAQLILHGQILTPASKAKGSILNIGRKMGSTGDVEDSENHENIMEESETTVSEEINDREV